MKSVHTDGGSPSIEKAEHQRKVPIGLDKSWESRRVEGLELMVSSFEQQKERQKKSCKSCSHHGFADQSCCSSHHHNHHHNHHNNNHHNHNHHHGHGNSADSGFLLPRHQEKARSHSGSKKNKMSTTTTSAVQQKSLLDGRAEGSLVDGRQQTSYVDAAHNSCLTPVNFKVRELEQQVLDLIHQLAQEKHQARQDKISLTKLQQQIARSKSEKPMKEMLMKELEQEKQRSSLLEHKLKDRNVECCCRNEMVVLKKENTRLNEVVQDLLPYKNKVERMKQSTSSSAALLEAELHRLRSKVESLEQDNSLTNMELRKLESIIKNCQECRSQLVGQIRLDSTPRSEVDSTASNAANSDKMKVLLERLKNLEAEKSSLVLENEAQFRHYEKCMEDVTSQILDALLVQKTLKEENSHLKKRVVRLEIENEMLKKTQFNDCQMSSPLNDHDASLIVPDGLCFRSLSFQSNRGESQVVVGAGEGVDEEEDDDDNECDGNYEGEGCHSSLSINEILDSAAASCDGNTNVDERVKSRNASRAEQSAEEECERDVEFSEGPKRSKNFDATERSCLDGADRSSKVFVDMSASNSFTLLTSCSCSHGQFVHLGGGESARKSSDQNGNLVAKSELIPLQRSSKASSLDSGGAKHAGHRKAFRGSDSGWKKFLPVGCTSPQEEKDEGYLSNKTSEISSDVGNPFVPQIS